MMEFKGLLYILTLMSIGVPLTFKFMIAHPNHDTPVVEMDVSHVAAIPARQQQQKLTLI